MFAIAFGTLKKRWPTLIGTFVATAIGAALIISSVQIMANMDSATDPAPQRFSAAPIVVAGSTSLNPEAIPNGRIQKRKALSDDLATRIAHLPGVEKVVTDRGFTVRLPGSDAEVTGRPWSNRDLTPYALSDGHAPVGSNDVVALSGESWARIGQTIDAVTSEGRTKLKVVGIAEPGSRHSGGVERQLFFSDEEASRLAPAIDAFGVWPASALSAVRDGLSDSPQYAVLAGDDRAKVEPDEDGLAVAGATALLGVMIMTICFVAVFVIASTSALSVSLRRRELGLLRALGATPGQTRRLILREATLLALLAGVGGAGLSLVITPMLVDWLSDHELTPAGLELAPSMIAIVVGALAVVPVALGGCYLTAHRAGRLRPAEALRDAAVDARAMTLTRWLVGMPCLAGAIALPLAFGISADPEVQLPLTLLESILLITGLTMLAPTLVPRLGGLLMSPLLVLRGAGATLVRAGTRTSIRRTASMAAPVLLAVGLTASLASMINSLDATDQAVAQSRIAPGVVSITSAGPSGLTEGDISAFAQLPGTTSAAVVQAEVVVKPGLDLGPQTANGFDEGAIDLALDVPVIQGSLKDLSGDSMALGEDAAARYGADVGSEITVWFPDGTARKMRVVAVLGTGFDINSIWMPRTLLADRNGPTAATVIHALPADPATTADIDRLARERGLQVESSAAYKSADPTDSSNMNGLALQAILGTALIYVAISLITTAMVTTASRRSELALLRLAGATPGQVSKVVVTEAAVATGIGGLLGMAVALIVTLGMEKAATAVSGPVIVSMPWALLFAIWGTCTLLAGAAALLSCRKTQRPAAHTLIA